MALIVSLTSLLATTITTSSLFSTNIGTTDNLQDPLSLQRHLTSTAMAATLQAAINTSQSDRLKQALNMTPRLLDVYFVLSLRDVSNSLICALIPLLMARSAILFPSKVFSYEASIDQSQLQEMESFLLIPSMINPSSGLISKSLSHALITRFHLATCILNYTTMKSKRSRDLVDKRRRFLPNRGFLLSYLDQ